MNQNQQKQVERIFGKNFTENEIPSIWRSQKKSPLLIGLPCEPYRTDDEEDDEDYAERADWETLRNYQESVRK